MKNKKLILLALSLVLIVGGLAYGYSNGGLLQGRSSGVPGSGTSSRTTGATQYLADPGQLELFVGDEYFDPIDADEDHLLTDLVEDDFQAISDDYYSIREFEAFMSLYILGLVNNTQYKITAHPDGYVSNSDTFTSESKAMGLLPRYLANVIPDASALGTEYANLINLDYAYKLIVPLPETDPAMFGPAWMYFASGLKVTAGDTTSDTTETVCVPQQDDNIYDPTQTYYENGAEYTQSETTFDENLYIAWTCKVPLAETQYKYKVSAGGYQTLSGSFYADRTKNSDPQQVVVTGQLTEGEDPVSYDSTITVVDAKGVAVTDLTKEDFSVYYNTDTSADFTFDTQATSGIYVISMEDSDVAGSYTLKLTPEGYVAPDGITIYDSQDSTGRFTIEYGYSIFPVDSSGAVSGATVTATSGTETVTCNEYLTLGEYYCVLTTLSADYPTYNIVASGYVDYDGTFDTYRNFNTSPAVTASPVLTASTDADPADDEPEDAVDDTTTVITYNTNYITVIDGQENPVTDLTIDNFSVTDDNGLGIVSFDDSGSSTGTYALNLQVTDDTNYDLTVSSTGLVSDSIILRDNKIDYQTGMIMKFGYRVLPVTEDGTAITGATVTAGTAYDVTCGASGTGETYSCLIPVSNIDLTFKVVASGYDDYEGEFDTDRTTDADAVVKAKAIMTATSAPTDADADGVEESADCDDNDDTVSVDQTYYVDADGDGLGDSTSAVSICLATAPTGYVTDSSDTDDSGSTTDTTTDTDGDGLTDYEENNAYSTDDDDTDTDADNISDYEEVITFGTDPNESDTDGDGSPDGTEVDEGTDPLTAEKVTTETETDLVCIDPFLDMRGHWAEIPVCKLYEQGIVKGKTAVSFDPNSNVTRAEFLKMIMLQGAYDPTYYSGISVTKYSDVNVGDWYYTYVALADQLGALWYPSAGVWQPNSPITRGDAMLLSVRLAKLTLRDFTAADSTFTDFDVNSYQAYAIILGEQYGVIKGYDDGSFKPNSSITRAEAAKIINASTVLFE